MSRAPLETRLLLIVLALASLSLLGAVAAGEAAQLRLIRSAPAAEATLTESPREIRLWFSQKPERAVSLIRLQGPAGRVEIGPVQAGRDDQDHALFAEVPSALPAARYEVTWRTSGGDGHPIRGTFAFTVSSEVPPGR